MNLLITGAAQINSSLIESLSKIGWEVDVHLDEREKVSSPEKYNAIVCNNLFAQNPITGFDNLRFIQLTSAGIDRMPLEYINKKEIILKNARGVYSVPIAEWVMANILNEYKHLPYFSHNQKEKGWNKDRKLRELTGKKIAIIGAGNIGDEIAKRLKAFDTAIYGFDIAEFSKPNYDKILLIDKLDPSQYDIIILAAPSTQSNYHLIDGDFISKMKKDAILLNISRGSLIDETSIKETLKVRKDITVCLDVFEKEPLAETSKLWDLPNVRISPHNSFVGEYNSDRLHKVIIQNLEEYLRKAVKR